MSYANIYNLETWFQSKLLHVYFDITNKDRYVYYSSLHAFYELWLFRDEMVPTLPPALTIRPIRHSRQKLILDRDKGLERPSARLGTKDLCQEI